MLSKIGLFKFNKNLTWNRQVRIWEPLPPVSTLKFGAGMKQVLKITRGTNIPHPKALLSRWFSKLPVLVGYVSAPWRVCVFHRISWCRRRSASSDSEASSRFEVSSRWLGRLQRWLKHRKFKVPSYAKLAKGWAFVDEPAVVALGWFVDLLLLCFGWTFLIC